VSIPSGTKYRTDLDTAAQVFERAFQHAYAFGCSNILCADDPDTRRVGIFCDSCGVWYNAPIPGPGEYTHWPWDMSQPGSAACRRAYVEDQVNLALALRPQREKTAWDKVLDPKV
jgi:hypothetical protein